MTRNAERRPGKPQHLALFANRCHERGLPMTPQRRAVLEAILDLDNHPTADQIHEHVTLTMPDVNRTTVYRTLEKLVAMDVITKMSHPGRAVRYDPRVELHHHLICNACDRVIDLDDEHLNALKIPDTSRLGFAVSGWCVQLRGLCDSCRGKEGFP